MDGWMFLECMRYVGYNIERCISKHNDYLNNNLHLFGFNYLTIYRISKDLSPKVKELKQGTNYDSLAPVTLR